MVHDVLRDILLRARALVEARADVLGEALMLRRAGRLLGRLLRGRRARAPAAGYARAGLARVMRPLARRRAIACGGGDSLHRRLCSTCAPRTPAVLEADSLSAHATDAAG